MKKEFVYRMSFVQTGFRTVISNLHKHVKLRNLSKAVILFCASIEVDVDLNRDKYLYTMVTFSDETGSILFKSSND